jgi:DNA-binding LacI/PurR family transcriptional regulator
LQEAGYEVPRQVSVIGFDNTANCTWLRPYLTTVDARLADVGAASVDMLLAQCAAPALPLATTDTTVTLPTSLVVRVSTAAPPASSPRATGRSGHKTVPQHISTIATASGNASTP